MKLPVKILLAMTLLSLTTAMYANPINCSVTPSNTACAPTLSLTYQVGNGPLQNIASSGPAVYSGGNWNVTFTPQVLSGSLFTGGQLVTNPDPFVGFSFGVVNATHTTMTFNFDYVTPYSGGPYATVQSVYADVLIDTNFSGQSTLAPVGSSYIMNTYDTGNLLSQVGLGTGCTTPLHVFVCQSPDVGSIGPLLYTSFATGTLEVKGSYTVTPGGQVTLTGRSALLPTPEPGTLVLLGTSLIGLAGIARKRFTR